MNGIFLNIPVIPEKLNSTISKNADNHFLSYLHLAYFYIIHTIANSFNKNGNKIKKIVITIKTVFKYR